MARLVAIVGPTGIGKSKLAIKIAQAFGGEIVNADSRQVYRYLDIGTAKPSQEELTLIPHHLIGLVEPDQDFSLAEYQGLAYKAISDIGERHKLALLVGGSGLYVWAVVEGWQIPRVPPDLEFRRGLAERITREGGSGLYAELMKTDPASAERIDGRNRRRLVRALEVSRAVGVPFSELGGKKPPPFEHLIIGLTADRAELYRRVDLRVEQMVERGLVEEVRKLLNLGYSLELPAMSGIGYREISLFLRGELALASAVQKIKFSTHRFIRHQYNWFRLGDERIHWFDVEGEVESEIIKRVAKFVNEGRLI